MATATVSDFIDHRTQALASVVLTRRRELTVTPIDVGPLDLLVQISRRKTAKGEKVDSLRPFFCIVKGTEHELPDVQQANRHLQALWNKPVDKLPRYSLPVLILLFSMVDDQGYYAWYSYPKFKNESAEDEHPETFSCETINKFSTDVIMQEVIDWYDVLDEMVIQE